VYHIHFVFIEPVLLLKIVNVNSSLQLKTVRFTFI